MSAAAARAAAASFDFSSASAGTAAADGVPQVAHGERAVHAGVVAREDGARRAHLLRRVGCCAGCASSIALRSDGSDDARSVGPTRGLREIAHSDRGYVA